MIKHLTYRISELTVSMLKTQSKLKLAQTRRAKVMHRTALNEIRLQLRTNKELLKRIEG